MSDRLKRALDLEIIEVTTNASWRPEDPASVLNATIMPAHQPPLWYRLLALLGLPWLTIPMTALVVSAGFLLLPASEVRGVIVSPAAKSVVAHEIRLTGEIYHLPRGYRLYVFVESNGLVWPKEAELRISGSSWEAQVFDLGNAPGPLQLSLWSVPPSGQRAIENWLRQSHRSRTFPGLPGIPGSIWLNSVSVNVEPRS